MRNKANISELYNQVKERALSSQELKRREEIAKDLSDADFKKRYGDDWKSVKIATATKMAKKEQVQESGHTDVAAAKTNVKVAMSALQKMSTELSKLNDDEALPSWWTNKVAIAVDSLDGMADYLDTKVEEVELGEGTWHIAKDMSGLKKLMKKPIKLGKEGKAAQKAVAPYIGDDQLYDDFYDAERADGVKADARPMIKKAMKRLNIKEEVVLDEKFTMKDFKDNEDANNHTENGVELVNMYGTPAEKKLMAQIAKNHDRRGSIERKDQELRNKLVKKYYPKLESVELDEGYKPVKANHYDVKIQGVKKKDVNAILKYIKVDGGNYDIEDIDDDQVRGGGMSSTSDGDIFIQGDDAGKLGMEIAKEFRGKVKVIGEEVELDEAFDFVLLDKDNKIVGRYSGKDAKKNAQSGMRSAHLPPMSIPKNEVGKMKIVPISPRDKKDIGDMVLAIGEEVNPITKIINSGKFSETEIKKFTEARDDDDEDDKSAMKNIIMQMRKVVSLRGNFKVEFKDGSKEKLEPRIAQAVQDKFNRMRRADDKEAFMDKISKSKRDLLNALKESINEQKLDEIPALAVPLAIGALRAAPTIAKVVQRTNPSTYAGAAAAAGQLGNWAKKKYSSRVVRGVKTKSEEAKSTTGYTLFHRSFSDAMQHAYAHAKSKMGMTVDPKEIDSKVATGPKKPGAGKTNSYSLKTNRGMLQIQVYNRGGSKPFELNMYSS